MKTDEEIMAEIASALGEERGYTVPAPTIRAVIRDGFPQAPIGSRSEEHRDSLLKDMAYDLRRAHLEMEKLTAERDAWEEMWKQLETHRAVCCQDNERERDEALQEVERLRAIVESQGAEIAEMHGDPLRSEARTKMRTEIAEAHVELLLLRQWIVWASNSLRRFGLSDEAQALDTFSDETRAAIEAARSDR